MIDYKDDFSQEPSNCQGQDAVLDLELEGSSSQSFQARDESQRDNRSNHSHDVVDARILKI